MNGNIHVQFLGEEVAATSPPYPTPGWATTQVYPARCPRGVRPLNAVIDSPERASASGGRSNSDTGGFTP